MYCNDPLPPVDRRITEIRHLNLPCQFKAPSSKKAWEERARQLREHIWISMGLWPKPTKSPLHIEITNKIERENYSIENVRFQSLPGFYVTGNLYRPTDKTKLHPAILNPHGHWENGRLNHETVGSIPARCINFARQGYIAFAWSMAGYNDSTQLAHRTFGDNQKLLWGLSLMGLQLWNSIRSVDFIMSLPDVDTKRIACTGASGGGTQTFMLTAIDDRVIAAAPVNMISGHMQGGCICENGPNLRINTNNMEIAALIAPRPLLLVSATGDWTVNTPNFEYPAIKSVYSLYGAENHLAEVQFDAEHNYNATSREAVYAWFGRWVLGKGKDYQFVDKPIQTEETESMLAIKPGFKPKNWVNETQLTADWITRAQKTLQEIKPIDKPTLHKYRQILSIGFQSIIGLSNTTEDKLIVTPQGTQHTELGTVSSLCIGRKNTGSLIPVTEFKTRAKSRGAVLVIHPNGVNNLIQDDKRNPGALIKNLLMENQFVMAPDLFLTGLSEDELNVEHDYYSTYNRTITANRVQDILTAVARLRNSSSFSSVSLIGIGKAGPWCLLACGLCSHIIRAVIDIDQFDTLSDLEYTKKLFIPGLRQLGGLAGAVALATPIELYLHNTKTTIEAENLGETYRVTNMGHRFKTQHAPLDKGQIIRWIIEGASE